MTGRKKFWVILSAGLVGIVFFTHLSQAVIIDNSTDGSVNINPPSGFPYWDSIGLAGGGSCVYIGDGYCLSAYHIKVIDFDSGNYSKTVNLGGVIYNIDDTSWKRFKLGTNDADLLQFRLTTIPAVPAVPVSSIISTMQATGTGVWMIGYGRDRAALKSYWDIDWVSANPPGYYSGYAWLLTRTKRWGTNVIDQRNLMVDDGYGNTQVYAAMFNSGVGDNECAVAIGDSGGPVFAFISNTWWLVGIDITRDFYFNPPHPNQPSTTTAYGNSSYFVDLSAYPVAVAGGTVNLGDFTAAVSGQQVTIEIRIPGQTTPLQTHVLTLQGTGSYSLITNLTGTYDLAAKGSHWLRQRKGGINITGSGVVVNFDLINGDCDGNNQVTTADLPIILMAMDTMTGDLGFSPQADLDGDTMITSTDLSIVLTNMDLTGDQ